MRRVPPEEEGRRPNRARSHRELATRSNEVLVRISQQHVRTCGEDFKDFACTLAARSEC